MPLTVDCVMLKQKSVELYLFKMSAHQLLKITYVDPQTRDYDAPQNLDQHLRW